MPIAFGHHQVITRDGSITSIYEEQMSNFNVVHSETAYIESVKVNNSQQALAEFLTLLDRYKDGVISNPGIKLLNDPDGNLFRVEKSWTVPSLR